jgi:hypothetical protein
VQATDEQLATLRTRGYVRIPGFLRGDELERAQRAFARRFPAAEDYFARPRRHAALRASPFAGVAELPFSKDLELDRLPFHPALTAIAERFLQSRDIRLGKAELWAKYARASEYEQDFHRDFPNHTLVVPSDDVRYGELQSFLFLNDVGDEDGPTEVVPADRTAHISYGRTWLAPDEPPQVERMTGAAGTLFLFRFDVFHRATPLTGRRSVRFTVQADFHRAEAPWVGKHNWGSRGLESSIGRLLVALTPRQRELLDFPAPGHDYWTRRTLDDVKQRYPDMDLGPYRAAFDASSTSAAMRGSRNSAASS